jgi:hypothetical protein
VIQTFVIEIEHAYRKPITVDDMMCQFDEMFGVKINSIIMDIKPRIDYKNEQN